MIPSRSPGYISLQLARQRFLLGEKNLNSLSDFLAQEMARRSPRHWTNDSITLDTVKRIEVPEWILANANPSAPSRFWQITDATLRAAIVRSLNLPEASLIGEIKPNRSTTLWQLAGPDRAILYLYHKDLWKEQSGRLVEVKRSQEPGGNKIHAKLLAASDIQPGLGAAIHVDGPTVGICTVGSSDRGFSLKYRMWDAKTNQLVAARLDGLPFLGSSEDGPLTSSNLFGNQSILIGDDILVTSQSRIRLIRDEKIETLAGDIRGYKDGAGAAKVRLADARFLGASNGHLYLTTAGPTGPTLRKLTWTKQ